MGMYIPPELRAIGNIEEKPVVCAICGSAQLVFSGMSMTSGYTQIGFDSRDPGNLTSGEVCKPPGILSVSAELLCPNDHATSIAVAMDWEKGGGVSIGTLSARQDISQEEREIAGINLAHREAYERQHREEGKGK